jgi:hypothetical protein
MAALGKARDLTQDTDPDAVETHKQELLQHLRSADNDEDPLWFFSSEDQSLDFMLSRIRSNIGRNQRALIFKAWVEYFRNGRAHPRYMLAWSMAMALV